MQHSLTSLKNVTDWLGNTSVNDNALLNRLIRQASGFILSYLERPSLFYRAYSETYDGTGSQRLVLRNWPVLAINSVAIGTQTIRAAASFGDAGYRLEPWNGHTPGTPQCLDLSGYAFQRGIGNVAVNYSAGYAVIDEPYTVPGANHTINVEASRGSWGDDHGVTFASDGTSLLRVTGTPLTGQYSVSFTTGIYTFAAADAGKAVRISYSFIPPEIEQACIEIVAERYRYKDRIGQSSKSLGGQETAAYSLKALSDYTRETLQPYRRVIPTC